MGFAIPVDAVRGSVEQIITLGRVVHPVIGIAFAPDAAVEDVRPAHQLLQAILIMVLPPCVLSLRTHLPIMPLVSGRVALLQHGGQCKGGQRCAVVHSSCSRLL